jgi:ferritin-like metal-binding protein YciE
MPVITLHDLFMQELQDLHSAESQIIEALPKMIEMADDEKLQAALEDHLEATQQHLDRLNEIDAMFGFLGSEKICEGMRGIIQDGERTLTEITDAATRDAAIIAAGQKVEHYEIAGYGTAAAYAKQLNHDEAGDLLKKTLDEEKKTDSDLSSLAEGNLLATGLNEMAAEE